MEVVKTVKTRLAFFSFNCWVELLICVIVDGFLIFGCLQRINNSDLGIFYYSVQEISSLNEAAKSSIKHSTNSLMYLLINHLIFECFWMFTTFLFLDIFCMKKPSIIARRCFLQASIIAFVCIVDVVSTIFTGILAKEVLLQKHNSSTPFDGNFPNPAYSLFVPLYFAKGGIGWLINLPSEPLDIMKNSGHLLNSINESNYYYLDCPDGVKVSASASSTEPVLPPPRIIATQPPNTYTSPLIADYYLDLIEHENELIEDRSPSNKYLTIIEPPIYARPKCGSNKSLRESNAV